MKKFKLNFFLVVNLPCHLREKSKLFVSLIELISRFLALYDRRPFSLIYSECEVRLAMKVHEE